MGNIPLVSIVTPSFNQGKFIEETIKSVITQDYENIEYFIFDAQSTDETLEIIKKYEDKITFWKSEKDTGQSNAINKGWKLAKGEIVSYLNSDDILLPGAISKVVDCFLKNPTINLVYGDCNYIDEDGNYIESGKGSTTTFRKLIWNGQTKYILQPASFYRLSAVKDIDYLDESLHYSMDYDLLIKLIQKNSSKYIGERLAAFRIHSLTKTNSGTEKHWRESIKIRLKYSFLLTIKACYEYLLFRFFSLVPASAKNTLRKIRRNPYDLQKIRKENE